MDPIDLSGFGPAAEAQRKWNHVQVRRSTFPSLFCNKADNVNGCVRAASIFLDTVIYKALLKRTSKVAFPMRAWQQAAVECQVHRNNSTRSHG